MEKISEKIISTTISLNILKLSLKKNIRIMLDEMFEKTFEEILKKIIITQKSEYCKKIINTTIQNKLKCHKIKLEVMFENILNEMLEDLTLNTEYDLEKMLNKTPKTIESDFEITNLKNYLEKIDECPYA